ncbi:MAG: RNA polymerase sigma-70 factor [Parabacteroides sp.]
MQEALLVRQLKNGSRTAFNTIYDMYAARVYAFCFQYIKSHQDVEEIVEDVFIKLWQNKNTIRNENSLQALLFIMAKGLLIDTYRARLNEPEYEEYVGYFNESSFSVQDTSKKIEYDDFCRELQRAMKKLSDTQRHIFSACKLQQLSNKEVADKYALNEQTVKNQLSLSLKILREELKKSWIWIVILLNC